MKTRWLRCLADRVKFPVEAGLEIQTSDIERWSKVLHPSVVAGLHDEAARHNAELRTLDDPCGYDVWRGEDINQFVIGLSYRLASGTHEVGANATSGITQRTPHTK